MPATDPKYVRLADHLSGRSIADISGGSGWAISGNEIKAFPRNVAQARFVRQKLAGGQLEVSSKSEAEEAAKLSARYEELVAERTSDGQFQESVLRDAAEQARAELDGSAEDDEDEEENDD